MMSLRFGAGGFGPFNNKPTQARHNDVRAQASPAAPAPTTPGPFSQVPLWCIPALAFTAAMPIYSYTRTEKMIQEGHAKAAIRIATEKGKKAEKKVKEVVPEPVKAEVKAPEPAPAPVVETKKETKKEEKDEKKNKWLLPALATTSGVAIGAAALVTAIIIDKHNKKGDAKPAKPAGTTA